MFTELTLEEMRYWTFFVQIFITFTQMTDNKNYILQKDVHKFEHSFE